MRISETIDSGEEQLSLRLEDVVNDDGEGSDDMGGEHPSVGLSGHGNGASIPSTRPSGQAQLDHGAPLLSQDSDPSHTQQLFDHAALEAQITDLLTAETTRPASRAAAAAAAARQRNSNSRAADKAKATADSRSKVLGDPASMSFPLSLAATQTYPPPPPPIGYPPQPSENESAEPDVILSESDQRRAANPPLPSDHAVSAASVLDAAAGHNPGQPQNFADITDILAHLSAHLESAAAAAAVAAGHPEATQTTVGSSGAEDDDDSPHEGRDDDEEGEAVPRATTDHSYAMYPTAGKDLEGRVTWLAIRESIPANGHIPVISPVAARVSSSRPAKRRRTEDEFSDMPAIGSFITPRAALPGGVRPVPQMSNSALISLGPSASGSGSNGPPASEALQAEDPSQTTTTPATHPEPPAWTEQANGVEQHVGPAVVGVANPMSNVPVNTQQMDEGEVYPEDWVQDIDGEGDSEEQMTDKLPQGTNHA
ncbi:hypothetical protein FRC06_002826 [Ceratobasidium sp. 370]|nr:hypothetical protein FRC06_002826 [Ceratobasidium sp. 370]